MRGDVHVEGQTPPVTNTTLPAWSNRLFIKWFVVEMIWMAWIHIHRVLYKLYTWTWRSSWGLACGSTWTCWDVKKRQKRQGKWQVRTCAGVQFDERSFNNFILSSLTFYKSKVCTNDLMFLWSYWGNVSSSQLSCTLSVISQIKYSHLSGWEHTL